MAAVQYRKIMQEEIEKEQDEVEYYGLNARRRIQWMERRRRPLR